MSKSFVVGLSVGLLLIVSLFGYQAYSHSCPCGFKWDYLTGGCVVDLNPPPCTGGGGGPNPSGGGGNGDPDPPGRTPAPDAFPPNCSLSVTNCRINDDWTAVEFTVADMTGATPGRSAPIPFAVQLRIKQRDSSGASCSSIAGEIDVPIDTPTKVPFDAASVAARFPMARPSGTPGAEPSRGLLASSNPDCRATKTHMAVTVGGCGCYVMFTRN